MLARGLLVLMIVFSQSLLAQEDAVQGTDAVQDQIFIIVEVMPSFPGGEDALFDYLNSQIVYPDAAVDAGIQGRVYVNFIVEPDGTISNSKVLRGIGGGCDEEALRVVSQMPEWSPGMQKGKPVRVQYNLPIRFVMVPAGPPSHNDEGK